MKRRTDKQIVDQTNELARRIGLRLGYEALPGYRFWESTHPRAITYWQLACIAQEVITNTDPDDAVANLDL